MGQAKTHEKVRFKDYEALSASKSTESDSIHKKQTA